MTAPNQRQVGGDHYAGSYQHWDFVIDYGLPYLEGCATKYLSRWRKKNGLQDLQKAHHYVEKIFSMGLGYQFKPVPVDAAHTFCEANDLDSATAQVFVMLCCDARSRKGLSHLLLKLDLLIAATEGANGS